MDQELIDKLIKLNGRISKENIETILKYTRLASQPGKKTIGVDIGTLGGQSAITMASAVEDIEVHTIDPICNPVIAQQIEKMGLKEKIHYYQMDSKEFSVECPEVINICFIDGQHNYPGVKADIENVGVRIRPGGYILFHDCNLYFNTVKVAVEEFKDKLYEFIEEVGGKFTEQEKEGSIWVGRML
jgi:predicted O-methyltransferase YrrM